MGDVGKGEMRSKGREESVRWRAMRIISDQIGEKQIDRGKEERARWKGKIIIPRMFL